MADKLTPQQLAQRYKEEMMILYRKSHPSPAPSAGKPEPSRQSPAAQERPGLVKAPSQETANPAGAWQPPEPQNPGAAMKSVELIEPAPAEQAPGYPSQSAPPQGFTPMYEAPAPNPEAGQERPPVTAPPQGSPPAESSQRAPEYPFQSAPPQGFTPMYESPAPSPEAGQERPPVTAPPPEFPPAESFQRVPEYPPQPVPPQSFTPVYQPPAPNPEAGPEQPPTRPLSPQQLPEPIQVPNSTTPEDWIPPFPSGQVPTLGEVYREPAEMECTGEYCGWLKAQVTTAGTALPVSGANVVIFREHDGKKDLVRVMLTDPSGETPYIPLPAPSPSLSQKPSNGVKPYSTYDMRITAPGFFTVESLEIPVFATIRTIQPVQMIPLPEFETNSQAPIIIPGFEPNL